jgi:hypothetical protein
MTPTTTRRIIIGVIPAVAALWAGLSLAAPQKFTVALSGGEQAPPVQTSGSGKAELTYDPANRMVVWSITYTGLSGPVTMAHFHGPAPAGKNAGVTLWLTRQGTTAAGDIKGGATLTPEQAEQFAAGQWYINLHTKEHPDGEIRGQVAPPKE